MKVWAQIKYGESYSWPDEASEFASIAAVKREMDIPGSETGHARSYFPCSRDEGMTAFVYFYDPKEARDPYPDRVLTIGPRGEIKVERT